MMVLKQDTVLYDVSHGVATIAMNRPHVKNAINEDMHEELYAAFQEARRDDFVKVIVLTGTGDSFSSGADLKSISIDNFETFDHGDYLKRTYNKLVMLMDEIQKPTIAYMNGTSVGAGLSLALVCDFRFAEHDAKIALSFLQIGLTPDAGASYFLPRIVGVAKAIELALGDTISAEEALRFGLITEIGNPEALAHRLKKVPLPAYSWMKSNIRSGVNLPLKDVLENEVDGQKASGQSEFHRQAVQSFIQGDRA